MGNFKIYNPEIDDRHIIPKGRSGIYIICLKEGAALPANEQKLIYRKFRGLRVLYVGISGNIYKRIIRQHLKDRGVSTLRKTLGVFWKFRLILRNSKSKKTYFSIEHESTLTAWLMESTVVYFEATDEHIYHEQRLIKRLCPVFNLKGNTDELNEQSRKEIILRRRFVA